MDKFVKGYEDDAGLDIVLDTELIIRPGFNKIELPCHYTPAIGEVAFLVPRSSTAMKGIFPIMVAIDPGYDGIIHGMIVNITENTEVFMPGERAFGIVNFVKGKDRAEYMVAKQGKRGKSWNASSGGNK